jgi:hypothetical protein
MTLIINGFFDNPSLNQAYIQVIQEFAIQECLIFSNLSDTELHYLQTTINSKINFYDFQQTISGDYTYVNWSKITPLDEETIYKMSNCEAVVLKMMDRLSSVPITYEERKRLYLRHLRYWNHITLHENIDLFLNSNIPHEIYDFIIYTLCKLKNIPCLLTTYSPIDGVIFISDDWEKEPATSIAKNYNQIISQNPERILLSERFRNHLTRQISLEEDPVPWYMASNFNPNITKYKLGKSNFTSLFALIKIAFESQEVIGKVIKKSIKKLQGIGKKREQRKIFSFYEYNTTNPDLSQKYIYVALHYQPECTTSPMAGAFVDQILIVQMIASFLPPDIYIYVKEHPFQTSHCRTISFYRDLLAIPQVRLISSKYSSFRLLDNCLAVATATGTAGWEGLFRQKPVLMFGHYIYQYAPKVFPIHSMKDCREAIDRITKDNAKPSLYEMEVYLKAMENHAIIAYADIAYSSVSQITSEENTSNLFSALRKKIIDLEIFLRLDI